MKKPSILVGVCHEQRAREKGKTLLLQLNSRFSKLLMVLNTNRMHGLSYSIT
ncbi:hypothetical protein HanPI659440_Chr03g0097601 [Helianthus annuus]|nr:hypothetical protein HanPI659440_Chr03g0097601 [Helianthus annuus]